jgi:hypothetical protein
VNNYEACMAAADQVEREPHRYFFQTRGIPSEKYCGSTGCAIGWLAHFKAFVGGNWRMEWVSSEARDIVGVSESDFYERMDQLGHEQGHDLLGREWRDGTGDAAAQCTAQLLRLYAEKYHADEKPAPIPPMPELSVEELSVEEVTLKPEVEAFIRNLKLPEFV